MQVEKIALGFVLGALVVALPLGWLLLQTNGAASSCNGYLQALQKFQQKPVAEASK